MIDAIRRLCRPHSSMIAEPLLRLNHLLKKRKMQVIVPAMVLVMVTACSGTAQTTRTSASLSVNYSGALPVESQLAAGSLLLEDTDMAIDSTQASELLVLWQAYRTLSSSDTAAQAEIDAVITQIEETMSTQQLEAIGAMKLTSDDLATLLQEYYAAPQVVSTASAGSSGSSAAFGPDGGGGFVVSGGPGPGGGDVIGFIGPAGGQGTILSAASTEVPAQNLTTTNSSQDRTALRLVDSLITLLQARADA